VPNPGNNQPPTGLCGSLLHSPFSIGVQHPVDIVDLANTVGRIEEKTDQVLKNQEAINVAIEKHNRRISSLESTRKIFKTLWSVVVALTLAVIKFGGKKE
jgi:hypothetical protein